MHGGLIITPRVRSTIAAKGKGRERGAHLACLLAVLCFSLSPIALVHGTFNPSGHLDQLSCDLLKRLSAVFKLVRWPPGLLLHILLPLL